MNLLRVLLALWLSLAVPTATLASVMNAQHCSRMAPAAVIGVDAHAGHGIQNISHAQHMQDSTGATSETEAPTSGCKCGCNCSNHQCTSSASGLLTGLYAVADFAVGSKQRAFAAPSRTASAHHLDLLRPPSLS